MAAKTGLMPFQDALMIKQMADQISASGKNEGVPPNNVMQEKLAMISGRAPVQQMAPPPQMQQTQPPQDPRMEAGLGTLPAPGMNFADGGIVAFAGDKGSQVKQTKWWELPPDLAAVVTNPSFERIAQAVMAQESGGNQNAVSSAGAKGKMQLMPDTIKDPGFGVRPPRNNSAEENYRVGKEYLAALYLKYGNMQDALRAYNFGFDNYDSFKTGKPTRTGKIITTLPTETINYAPGVFDKIAKAGFNPTALEREIAGGAFAPPAPTLQTNAVPTPPSGIPGVAPTPAMRAPARMPPPPAPVMNGPTVANAAGLPALVGNDPHTREMLIGLAENAAEEGTQANQRDFGIPAGTELMPTTKMIGNAPTTEPTPYAEQPEQPMYGATGRNRLISVLSRFPGASAVGMATTPPSVDTPSPYPEDKYNPNSPPTSSPAATQETAPPENGGYEGRAVAPEEYLKPIDQTDYLSGFQNTAMDKYAQMLKDQQKSDAKDREYDRRMALANAGFKMAEAAQTHNFMGSLAIGGQEAVKGLTAAKRDADKAQREMDRLLAQMEVAKEDKLNSLYAKYNEAKTSRDEKIAEVNWRYANTDVDQAKAAAAARQGALTTQLAVSKEGRELLKQLEENSDYQMVLGKIKENPSNVEEWKAKKADMERRALAPLMGAARGAGITANFPTYGTRTVSGG
jgi:soluble lytic murein transglycosylase-like protein